MEDFKKYYEFPLYSDGFAYIWTNENGMALMFDDWCYGNVESTEIFEKLVTSVINGEINKNDVPYLVSHTFKYNENATIVDEKDEVFLIVRGWGHLTGCGGLKLPAEKAAKIQDEFGQYVVDKLNGK